MMHEIKCERCGNDIDRSQLYIVIFQGVMIDKFAQYMCCKSCLTALSKDLRAYFTSDILDKCISCYHLEIINDIVEEGEQE